MQLIPLVLRPALLSLKNRHLARGARSVRESIGLLASGAMIVAMYLSTHAALQGGSSLIRSGTLDPFVPLSLLLTSLFMMLAVSAAIAAIGSLFLAKDLDLLMSSPLPMRSFLLGRSSEVALSVSWMVCVFGLPSLVAFGVFFDCGPLFFLAAPIVSLAVIAVAVLLGMLAGLLFGVVVSPQRGRTVLLMLFMLSLLLFFCSINSSSVTAKLDSGSLSAQASAISAAAHAWTPGHAWARAILDVSSGAFLSPLLVLLSACAICVSLWHVLSSVASRWHVASYTRLRNEGEILRLNSRAGQRWSRWLLPLMRSDRRALISKEFKLFARDLTHTIQLSMLLAICFIYLYNFRALEGPASMADEVRAVWELLLLLVNVGLSFLVVTCVCSRFVFPSVSLEGASFWILQSAPVSMRNILRAKVAGWFVPVAAISGVVFVSGAMAIGADEPLVVASFAVGVVLAYGLVGLSVGLGALFAQFEWEYSNQVSSNVGSFLFMAISLLFLVVNLLPIAAFFGAYALAPEIVSPQWPPSIILVAGLLALAIINYACAAAALSVGSRSLKAR